MNKREMKRRLEILGGVWECHFCGLEYFWKFDKPARVRKEVLLGNSIRNYHFANLYMCSGCKTKLKDKSVWEKWTY